MKANLPGTKQAEKHSRQAILKCVIYGVALSLHDVYGFGAKRTQRVINALSEIMEGYADQDGAAIVESMKAELKARRIEFDIVGRR